jgi:hypothetical protein
MTVVVGAIALVFPVLVGLAIFLMTRRWLGTWGFLLAVISAVVVLLMELIPLWLSMGGILDRTEPSDVPGQKT